MSKPAPLHDELQLVIICGLAGSGYSTALNILEDIGFSAVDNLPLALFDKLISIEIETEGRKLAVSLDGRTSGFDADGLMQLIADTKRRLGDKVRLVFLSASDDAIYRRFNATRRHHPLDHQNNLMAAIALDWTRMAPIETIADIAIDTSTSSPSNFRSALLSQLGIAPASAIPVHVQSFSYRGGVPRDADFVLDARFLDNPHWQEGLAALTGLDEKVQGFIATTDAFAPSMQAVKDMLEISLPRFAREGRPQFSIAVGCTGGRHRSVFCAVTIAEITRAMGHDVKISHRELDI